MIKKLLQQETYKRVFHDEDGTEVLIIGDSVLDYFNIAKDDNFFKLAIDEPVREKPIKWDKIYYTLYADAKENPAHTRYAFGLDKLNEPKVKEAKEMETKTEVLSMEYSKALSLNRKIKANAQILADVIFELGTQLKEMRDGKLYKELGYNSFKDYCKSEIGLADRQTRAYITIAENLGNNEKWHSSAEIGVKKLEIISRLDEDQRQQIKENINLEDITVKQLQEEVKKLKAENTELKELENRPVDVAVQEDTETSREISNLRREIKAREESIKRLTKQYNQLEDDMTTATQDAYRKGLEDGKNNNGNQNQDAVFEIVTDNFEDAFYKYFSVIAKK